MPDSMNHRLPRPQARRPLRPQPVRLGPDGRPETGAQRQVRELIQHCTTVADLMLRLQYRRWR